MTKRKPIPFGDLGELMVDAGALPALEYIRLLVDLFGAEPIIAAVRNHERRPVDWDVTVEKWIEGQPPQRRMKLIQDGTAIRAIEHHTDSRCRLHYDIPEDFGYERKWFVSMDDNCGLADSLIDAVRQAVSEAKQEEAREEALREALPLPPRTPIG